MEKIIRINDKEYKLKSSAFTPFAYKNENRVYISNIR